MRLASLLPATLIASLWADHAALAQDLTAPHVSAPLGLLVNERSQRRGKLTREALIAELDSLLGAHTDLKVELLDSSLVRRCVGKLACMVAEVRQEQGTRYPRYLLVATHFTHEQMTERLSLLLIDTERALRIYDDADREQPDWVQQVETQILSSGAMIPERSTDIFAADDGLRLVRELMETDYRTFFEKAGHWRPFGIIELTSLEPGALIWLDEAQVGVARDGLTRIVRVPAGAHQLRVDTQGAEPFVAELEVRSDQAVRIAVEVAEPPAPEQSALRQGVAWTGVVTAAVGVALVIYGAMKPSEVQGYCLHTANVECEGGSRFTRFGDGSEAPFESGNGSGPPIAPLGIGLAGMGLVWSAGTWLFGDGDDVPWIQGLAGALVFGLTLGLGIALEGDDQLSL